MSWKAMGHHYPLLNSLLAVLVDGRFGIVPERIVAQAVSRSWVKMAQGV